VTLSSISSRPNLAERVSRLFDGFRRWVAGRLLEEAQNEARTAEARLRAALDAMPEGIVFLDEEGRYVLWNQTYAEIYHRSADLFAPGARLIDTLRVGVARGDYPDAIGHEEAWLADRAARLENPGQRHEQRLADGRWLMIEERRTADGGVIGLRVDITDMKRQAAELEAALTRAEAANKAKSEFLANMSHEIRTPLNGVLGLTEVLSRTSLDPMQRDLVRTVINSAGALNQILADILDFSRLEAGKVEIEPREFYLADLVRNTAALFQPAASEKAVGLHVNVSGLANDEVMGDPTRIKQILTNLISNALKFTESGRIDVRVDALGEDRYRFQVADTGVGFDSDFAERLFDRFEQADNSITRRFGGAGLGLAICRQLTRLMGGSISAAGEPGRGATFSFVLPLPPAEPLASAAPQPPPEAEAGLRVLVADDNPTNRKVAELILGAAGAEVVSVEDGLEAIAAFEAGRFDVILMDLQMPRMDGLTAIRAIREREKVADSARTPIVVLSANVMHEHRSASAAAGADGHLGKPFRAEDLIEAILRASDSEPAPLAEAG